VSLRIFLAPILFGAAAALLSGQTEPPPEPPDTPAPAVAEESPETPKTPAESEAARTSINLLGQTDSDSGESRRNENVQFNLVDNNAVKELNIRLGTTATLVEEFAAERGYFGTEYGNPPQRPIHAVPARGPDFHGNVYWRHNNSVVSARSFFQVGEVQPARENLYGGAFTAPLWRGGFLSVSGSQNKIRGNVNGNVLIPLPEERTPLATDPALAAAVSRLLSAYPNEAPNRPDIALRAHNTNSLQSINTDSARGQLDQKLSEKDLLSLRYQFTAQNVDAFQLVVGQNPDTDTKSHGVRLTWNRAWSPATTLDATLGFDRLGSLLLPASGALGPVTMGGQALTTLGPSPIIPIDRAQNRFRYGATLQHLQGKHQITAGFALTRLQYNGTETDGHRGILQFRSDFGRDLITNLRLGQPSQLIIALGEPYRAFRNWQSKLFVGDRWQASKNWTVHAALRYEPSTRPRDVTGASNLNFDSDLNNFGGSFGFARRLPGKWGVLRAAYGLLYGEIFPVTYGQDRLNAPGSIRIVLLTPNLLDPFEGVDPDSIDRNGRASVIEVGPDLATPYSHQYNFSWETELAQGWRLQTGYVGSRSHKLIITYFLNRGRADVPGVPLASRTTNQRRPDQSRFEYLFIHNGSRGYYDAGRVSLIAPRWRGLTLNASYWFSKSLDIGGDYTNTASGPDARAAIAQTEFESHRDLKGLSRFDQPHAFLLQAGFETPKKGPRWMRRSLGGWMLSTVTLLKSGTPFTVESGADSPGVGNVDGSRGDRPMLLDPSVLGRTIGDPDTSAGLLPRSAFRFINAPDELAGNLGRNTFRKGKIANVNASLARTWTAPADWTVELRLESINLFNTPQFAEPGRNLTAPNFGQINNTLNDGRTFRAQLRFGW